MGKVDNLLVQLLDESVLSEIRVDLYRRKDHLLELAASSSHGMVGTDYRNILSYLGQGKLPEHPKTVEELLREFACSCLSYNVIRTYLAQYIGDFPDRSTIGVALSAVLGESAYRRDDVWTPTGLHELTASVAKRAGLTNDKLGSKEVVPRILGVLIDGSAWFHAALANGLSTYYGDISSYLSQPSQAWHYLEIFSRNIRQVGPPLAADYMKNIGFHQFVKPDFHFLNELPKLLDIDADLKPKEQFILGWKLAEVLQMPAFHLDHILYQWGRYCSGKQRHKVLNKKSAIKRVGQSTQCVEKPAVHKYPVAGNEEAHRILRGLMSIEKWRCECTKLTIHRQKQLKAIFELYGGCHIPIAHFTSEIANNPSIRNKLAYPAICALHAGILIKTDNGLILPEGVVLGVRVLP